MYIIISVSFSSVFDFLRVVIGEFRKKYEEEKLKSYHLKF